MQLIIHPADELPIYRQIMRQITEAIAGARLKAGEKLPSHRDLSETLVIAPLTVKKAYDELEALGYIETQRGRGTFVCERPPRQARAQQLAPVRETARKLLAQAYLAGMRLPEVIEVLRQADREITAGPEKQKEHV